MRSRATPANYRWIALLVCAAPAVVCRPGHPQQAFQPRAVDLLPTGLAIEKTPPTGWSHLIIKSHPRIRDEDLNRVNSTTARLSSAIFTAFCVNVANDGGSAAPYRLEKIAVGVGTRINGKDLIVSPDSQGKLGARLGMLGRQVLSRTYERQKDVAVLAQSPTSAIVDAPVVMRRRQHNRFVNFRYLLLVDSKTGGLDALLWLVDRNEAGEILGAVGDIECLPPNKIEDAALYVDDAQFTLGLPSDLAFGVMRLPQGKQRLAMPEDLRPLAGRARLDAAELAAVAMRLRSLLQSETTRTNE